LAIAKQPELLVLEEPVGSLDPLARREFLQDLMTVVSCHGVSVVLSSHLLSDLERVCDTSSLSSCPACGSLVTWTSCSPLIIGSVAGDVTRARSRATGS
jgi:ABC-type Na+ transport system ATPase subunit NatA